MMGKMPGTHKTLMLVGKKMPRYQIIGDTGKHCARTLDGISSGSAGMTSSGSPSVYYLLAKPHHLMYTSFASTEPSNTCISEV